MIVHIRFSMVICPANIWAIVDTMPCNSDRFVKNPEKDFSRDRKLGFISLIRFFLSMESGCINHELLKYFSFLPEDIPSASAFIQPGRLKNEFATLCRMIDRYTYGGCPIFVADRGFASYNVFAHALEKGCFFAIRAKDITIKAPSCH